MLVEDCFVDVGDDTVAIKSGMDWAGRHFAHPAENILFRNCHFVQNAMAIGSEQSGGVANVRAFPDPTNLFRRLCANADTKVLASITGDLREHRHGPAPHAVHRGALDPP